MPDCASSCLVSCAFRRYHFCVMAASPAYAMQLLVALLILVLHAMRRNAPVYWQSTCSFTSTCTAYTCSDCIVVACSGPYMPLVAGGIGPAASGPGYDCPLAMRARAAWLPAKRCGAARLLFVVAGRWERLQCRR